MGLDSILTKPIEYVVTNSLDEIVYLDDNVGSIFKKLSSQAVSRSYQENLQFVIVFIDKETSEFKAGAVAGGLLKLLQDNQDLETPISSLTLSEYTTSPSWVFNLSVTDSKMAQVYNIFNENKDIEIIFIKDEQGKYLGNIKRFQFAEKVKDLLP